MFGLFLLFAIMNCIAMNICIQVFVWIYVFIPLGYIPRTKIAVAKSNVVPNLRGTVRMFSQAAATFYIHTSSIYFLYIFTKYLCDFFILATPVSIK